MPSQFESLVLDGLSLNDGTVLSLESLTMPPSAKRPEWVSGADSDGAVLSRDPFHDNRIIEARIRVEQQATKDLALAKIALIVDKLEECERNLDRGLALVWTPADATTSPITFRCLSGEITEMPIDVENGWMVRAPAVTVRLTCLPFGEGTETLAATVTSSAPIVTLELTGVAGDMAATGRLVVTDAAAKDRRYAAWGLESRYYPTSSPPSLIVDSANMVTSGFAGATTTRTGAYSGASNNVIRGTLRTQLQAICGLPTTLTHVGWFRPQLRYWATQTTIALRLTYQANDGPLQSLSFKAPVDVGWNSVDLGLITISPAAVGTQRWTGRIDAYSTAAGGETLDIDALWLMPAERYGRARAPYTYSSSVVTGFDQFTGITPGTVLEARTAPVGGVWDTTWAGGPPGDFAAANAPAEESGG